MHRNVKPYAFVMNTCSLIVSHVDTTVCWAVYNACVTSEYQSYGVMMHVKQINQWANPMGHVQRTNPMGTGGKCTVYLSV